MALWKALAIWIVASILLGLGGIWVLNTLFSLGLAYDLRTWAATSLGLALINSGRAIQSLTNND